MMQLGLLNYILVRQIVKITSRTSIVMQLLPVWRCKAKQCNSRRGETETINSTTCPLVLN
jgi:hypothetical protein